MASGLDITRTPPAPELCSDAYQSILQKFGRWIANEADVPTVLEMLYIMQGDNDSVLVDISALMMNLYLLEMTGGVAVAGDWDVTPDRVWSRAVWNTIQRLINDRTVTFDIFDQGLWLVEHSTPDPPSTGRIRFFTRPNGGSIELVALSATGEEFIICRLGDDTIVSELQLNWVE